MLRIKKIILNRKLIYKIFLCEKKEENSLITYVVKRKFMIKKIKLISY